MKRLLALFTVAAFLVAVPASHLIWSKAHVPVKKVQVCHKGKVITVSKNALNAHQKHGDCQLPACDFTAANIFQTGQDCSGVGPADSQGRCTGLATRTDACGQTAACPAGPACF